MSKVVELDHHDESVAGQLHTLFQRSYLVEARLIGVLDFPPLKRTVTDLQSGDARFFGYMVRDTLAAAAEISVDGGVLNIDGLVVDPDYFRRGLATALISFVLDQFSWETAVVQTGAANEPAISFYEKLGFRQSKTWRTDDGIELLQLQLATAAFRNR